jgi:isoprenylcysteine carboxyl methyltransferase (ICMT) family protein YpbQ
MGLVEYAISAAQYLLAYFGFVILIFTPVWFALLWGFQGFWKRHGAFAAQLGFYCMVILVILLAYYTQGIWQMYKADVPDWLAICGWILALAASVLLRWSQTYIEKVGGWTPSRPTVFFTYILQSAIGSQNKITLPPMVPKGKPKLVTSGPYSLARHPMYGIAAPLFVLGAFFGTGYLLLLPGLILYYAIMSAIADREEKPLVKEFGREYLEYRKRVPKLLPKFMLFCTGRLFL